MILTLVWQLHNPDAEIVCNKAIFRNDTISYTYAPGYKTIPGVTHCGYLQCLASTCLTRQVLTRKECPEPCRSKPRSLLGRTGGQVACPDLLEFRRSAFPRAPVIFKPLISLFTIAFGVQSIVFSERNTLLL